MEAYISNFKMGIGYLRPQYFKNSRLPAKVANGVVASATNGIYVAAMYQYAIKKELPSDFNPSLIPPPVSGFLV
jgi:hypothetical protein